MPYIIFKSGFICTRSASIRAPRNIPVRSTVALTLLYYIVTVYVDQKEHDFVATFPTVCHYRERAAVRVFAPLSFEHHLYDRQLEMAAAVIVIVRSHFFFRVI